MDFCLNIHPSASYSYWGVVTAVITSCVCDILGSQQIESLTNAGYSTFNMNVTTDESGLTSSGWDQPRSQNIEILTMWPLRSWATITFAYGISLVSIVGNFLVIVSYIKFSTLHGSTNMFVFNQSLSDISFCISIQLCILMNTALGIKLLMKYKVLCLIFVAIVVQSTFFFLANRLVLSAERLFAVAFPFRYLNFLTETNVKIIIIYQWIIHIILILLPVFGWNSWTPRAVCFSYSVLTQEYNLYLVSLPSGIVLVLCAVVNIGIGTIAVRVKKQILSTMPSGINSGNVNPIQSVYKVTAMMLIITGVFYLTTCPLLVHFILQSIMNKRPEWLSGFRQFARICLMITPATNPIIFAWRNSQFKEAFRRLLHLRPSAVQPQLET